MQGSAFSQVGSIPCDYEVADVLAHLEILRGGMCGYRKLEIVFRGLAHRVSPAENGRSKPQQDLRQ
jgi:hypothetical protein